MAAATTTKLRTATCNNFFRVNKGEWSIIEKSFFLFYFNKLAYYCSGKQLEVNVVLNKKNAIFEIYIFFVPLKEKQKCEKTFERNVAYNCQKEISNGLYIIQ